MILNFVRRFFNRALASTRTLVAEENNYTEAVRLMTIGDKHGAIVAFRQHLKKAPSDVVALNDFGVCLSDIGNVAEAGAAFELAYSLDDTFPPSIANHAKVLGDQRDSSRALLFLQYCKIFDPYFSHADAIYANICLNLGEVEKARHFQLRAWLGNFDNLRLANCYLFFTAYGEADELRLAAEHRFWAETVRPIENQLAAETVKRAVHSRKIRIGYWSPDFRNHSVRYFSQPLLANHDRAQYEIFAYHDFPGKDAKTAFIQTACDHFHDVSELSDGDMYKLVCSHDLDILVELAGHTSHNRMNLFQQHFATIQITALGYPPTTGLSTVDAKLLDRHVAVADSEHFYAESPLVLPTSFWCFDPMEDAPITPQPPIMRNGYLTFGCVGNIAKISPDISNCWRHILNRVPSSRLLIRSLSFEDAVAEDITRARLAASGIDLGRVDLKKPEGGAAFFSSYNEIDIILDTFPFNGGTTTCFATYMGVPVVSLFGQSLISRMGLSILTNLGEPDLAVDTLDAYTNRAVALAGDLGFLQRFRREARERFQKTGLGNGKLFTAEFEEACKKLLEQKEAGTFNYKHDIALLPASEIIRRAYAVFRVGQIETAQRIVNHCLQHYPNCGSAHILVTQLWNDASRFEEAVNYLEERLENFSEDDQAAALITLVRLNIFLSRPHLAQQALQRLERLPLNNTIDRIQTQLYRACLTYDDIRPLSAPEKGMAFKRVHIIVPCSNEKRFAEMRAQMMGVFYCPEGWLVSFQRCSEAHRIVSYDAVLQRDDLDVVVIAQKNIQIHSERFLVEIAAALEQCDAVGVAGATTWDRLDWRTDDFTRKCAGFLTHSREAAGFLEVQLSGIDPGALVAGMVILDGSLLAINPKRVRDVQFDPEIVGAELLLEEEWSHQIHKSGLSISVHRALGVLIDYSLDLDSSSRSAARGRVFEKLGFDAFALTKENHMMLSTPVSNAAEGLRVCESFFKV